MGGLVSAFAHSLSNIPKHREGATHTILTIFESILALLTKIKETLNTQFFEHSKNKRNI